MKPTLSFLVALILFAGCDRSSGNTAAGAKVRDSAGIAIVDNSPAPAALEVAVESFDDRGTATVPVAVRREVTSVTN